MSGFWNSDGSAAFTETRVGFLWGGMLVKRIADDPQWGTVIEAGSQDCLGQRVQIRVSPQGRSVQVFAGDKLIYRSRGR